MAGLLTLGHAAAIVAASGGAGWLLAAAASLVALANGAGRVAGGWLGDHISARAILIATLLVSGFALLGAALWPIASIAFAGIGLVGLGYGCLAGSYPVIVAHLYGRDEMAQVYGRIFTAWGLAAAVAPYAGGALFDLTGTYEAVFILCGALALLAAPFALSLPGRTS
jgi:OFA family oxalate/formate antiporter-like MFS transporter